MEKIAALVEELFRKEDSVAYAAFKQLRAESERTEWVYPFFDRFVLMMEDRNSYIRSRGLLLIAENARWDSQNKIGEIFETYLKHILDEKPITARQCIKTLPMIATYKPELSGMIQAALEQADTNVYSDSMKPLVDKDIASAVKKLIERKTDEDKHH